MAYVGNTPDSFLTGTRSVFKFVATAGQTAFSGADANGVTLDLGTLQQNDVYLNGAKIILTDDYTISGETLTLGAAAAAGDILEIVTQTELGNNQAYTKTEAEARYINHTGDVVNGTIQMGGGPGNNITFADNNKVIFGAGSDLQIFHDGSNSFINEVGAGDLTIKASNNLYLMSGSSEIYAKFTADGASTLYHNNLPKLATTATGIDVTGTVSTSLVSASTSAAKMAEFNSTHTNHGYIVLKEDSADKFYLGASTAVSGQAGAYTFYTQSGIGLDFNTGGVGAPRMRIDSSGNVGIGTTNGDVTNDNTAARTYVSIIGAANRGRLNIGSSASNGADAGTLSFTNGTNSLADISVDTNSGVQNAGKMYINSTDFISFATAGTPRMRIDTSGNVLVGMLTNGLTSTGIGLVKDGVSHMYSAGSGTNATLMLGRGGSDGNVLSFNRSGTTFGNIGGGTSSGELVISTNSGIQYISQKLTGDTDGIQYSNNGTYHLGPWISKNNTVDLGRSNSGWRNLYLTGGIQFDARSNKLDDYEEGTFTPTHVGGSGTGSFSDGKYTKIGRVVHINFSFNFSSGGGSMSIGSLPFAADNHSVGIGREDVSNGYGVYGRVYSGTSTIGLFATSSTGNASAYQVAAGGIRFTLTYQTAL